MRAYFLGFMIPVVATCAFVYMTMDKCSHSDPAATMYFKACR